MKKNLLYLILTCISIYSYSQVSMVLLEDQVFYLGIENPIILLNKSDTICSENVKGSASVEVRKASNGCYYYVMPKNKTEPAFIQINHQKLYFSHLITTTPDPIWSVKIEDSFVSIKNLEALSRLSFIQPYFNYEMMIKTESFFITIIRDDSLIYTESVIGDRLSYNFKQKLKVGDQINFSNIVLNAPEGRRILDKIRFNVKN